MPRSLVIALLRGAVGLASWTPAESPPSLEITITANAFVVHGATYKSKGELASAPKALPPPATIYLRQEPSTTPERHAEALAANSEAGIRAPVAFVGNEAFR